ncbi:MAG TPA: YbfB/YjiJ family MFS transporter [Candidatus Angelobacter sp.]
MKPVLPSPMTISAAGMISLAVAVGVGRFAFTPLFPLMVRDGLLTSNTGALLAGSNYLGYFVGAVLAAHVRLRPTTLLRLGLAGIVVVTAAVGWTSSVMAWTLLRCVAGAFSAWSLVGTTAWAFAWLALLGRSNWAGAVFAGVGVGIAGAGVFCMLAARPGILATRLWIELAVMACVATSMPLIVSRHGPTSNSNSKSVPASGVDHVAHSRTGGLVVCYSVFGFGYILPATYLPALARQLVDDPKVFGWAWPIFGIAAALSTVIASWGLQRFNRLQVWAASHLLMAAGVLLPSIWLSITGVVIAALLVGGTFMVISMVGMQEARARAEENATTILAQMTAGFAFGQLVGPVASAVFARFTADALVGLSYAMRLAAAGLMISAMYLGHESRQRNKFKEHCHG